VKVNVSYILWCMQHYVSVPSVSLVTAIKPRTKYRFHITHM